jgi:hypothetical protein
MLVRSVSTPAGHPHRSALFRHHLANAALCTKADFRRIGRDEQDWRLSDRWLPIDSAASWNRVNTTVTLYYVDREAFTAAERSQMRTMEFDAGGGGGVAGPRGSTGAGRFARLALFVVIYMLSFGWGVALGAAYEAFDDMQVRGEMDPT